MFVYHYNIPSKDFSHHHLTERLLILDCSRDFLVFLQQIYFDVLLSRALCLLTEIAWIFLFYDFHKNFDSLNLGSSFVTLSIIFGYNVSSVDGIKERVILLNTPYLEILNGRSLVYYQLSKAS